MAVTESDVRTIAALARLRVTDDQLPALVEQMNDILGHVDVLTRVDTATVTPTSGVGADGMVLREDVVNPIPMRSTADALAAESRDGFILVPRLSTHGGH
jgi:aspartyl-tRNA(Asn)/glutamyl-tRNA(Gln) amidotransferase subunit C